MKIKKWLMILMFLVSTMPSIYAMSEDASIEEFENALKLLDGPKPNHAEFLKKIEQLINQGIDTGVSINPKYIIELISEKVTETDTLLSEAMFKLLYNGAEISSPNIIINLVEKKNKKALELALLYSPEFILKSISDYLIKEQANIPVNMKNILQEAARIYSAIKDKRIDTTNEDLQKVLFQSLTLTDLDEAKQVWEALKKRKVKFDNKESIAGITPLFFLVTRKDRNFLPDFLNYVEKDEPTKEFTPVKLEKTSALRWAVHLGDNDIFVALAQKVGKILNLPILLLQALNAAILNEKIINYLIDQIGKDRLGAQRWDNKNIFMILAQRKYPQGVLANLITNLARNYDKENKILDEKIKGENALSLALKAGNTEVVRAITKLTGRGPDEESIQYISDNIYKDDIINTIKLLPEKYIAASNYQGKTLLMLAAQGGYLKPFQAILAKIQKNDAVDAQKAIDAQDPQGNTALILAVQARQEEMVGLLLKAHADPELKNGKGQTALKLAKGRGWLTATAGQDFANKRIQLETILYWIDKKIPSKEDSIREMIKNEPSLLDMVPDTGKSETILIAAIKNGLTEQALDIIKRVNFQGVNPDLNKEASGSTALTAAIQHKNKEVVEALLAANVAITEKAKIALQNADQEIKNLPQVKDLLEQEQKEKEQKAKEEQDVEKQLFDLMLYPLTEASPETTKKIETITELIEKNKVLLGAKDPNRENQTVLMYAIKNGDVAEKFAQVLIAKSSKEQLDQVDSDGNNALMYAAQHATRDTSKITEDLLKKRINWNMQNKSGQTALMLAARAKNFAVITELIRALKNETQFSNYLNKADKEQKTALIYAVEEGDDEIVSSLLQNKADVSIADEVGYTALVYAAAKNYIKIVEKLVNSSRSINRSMQQQKAEQALKLTTNNEIKKIIQQKIDAEKEKEKPEPEKPKEPEKPATLQEQLKEIFNWIMLSKKDKNQTIKKMIEKNKQLLNERNSTTNDDTILIRAIRDENEDLVNWLIDQEGIDLNIAGGNGVTALMWAASKGDRQNEDVVKKLLEKGARKDLKDKYGATALDRAELVKNKPMIDLLEDKKPEPEKPIAQEISLKQLYSTVHDLVGALTEILKGLPKSIK